MRAKLTQRNGFTIIELVVVIGVIMVLLGIFLPALSGARQSAESTKQASQLRQLSLVISMYCDQWDDVYPFADTKPDYFPLDMDPSDPRIGRHWSHALIDAGSMTLDEAIDESLYDVRNVAYSLALYHDPNTMKPDSIVPWELRECVPIRTHQATYPSAKGTLFLHQVSGNNTFSPWCCLPDSQPGPVSFADGSLSILSWDQLPEPHTPPILDIGHRVISTWHGIRGRDR